MTALDEALPVTFSRAGTTVASDALTQWSGTRTLQSTSLTTRTFDYKNPSSAFNAKGTSLPTMPNQGGLPDQAEVYEYTGAYTFMAQERGDALSKTRLEEWESRSKRFFGIGGWRAADAGKRFTLDGHPDHDGSTGAYQVEIEAQRTTVPFRSPFEHSKPATHLETAVVVGPQNEEVYTDELNRIKVRFIWDLDFLALPNCVPGIPVVDTLAETGSYAIAVGGCFAEAGGAPLRARAAGFIRPAAPYLQGGDGSTMKIRACQNQPMAFNRGMQTRNYQ